MNKRIPTAKDLETFVDAANADVEKRTLSDTPRTDEVEKLYSDRNHAFQTGALGVFARQLERELAFLERELKELRRQMRNLRA